jgi:hypothetical protein
MSASETHDTQASAAPSGAPPSVGALPRTGARAPWLFMGLLALVAVGAFLLGKGDTPVSFDQQLPSHVAAPPHASLVRREDFLQEHIQNWYYAVPEASHEALTAFYHAQLSQDGWNCFRAMTSTNMSRDGKAYSGSSVYMTAARGNTKAQIYTADQEYGAFLLQDDLPENAIALKISLETTDNTNCV